ncbi:MAG: LytS/YhcK type 5TM receptor domain-containing protein [Syntrophales bacterium]
MVTTWILTPGIVFDTRSVLIGISGLFLGLLPVAIAMAMAVTFRAALAQK